MRNRSVIRMRAVCVPFSLKQYLQRHDHADLQENDERNTDHEPQVLGFVTDQMHGDVHRRGTAQKGQQKQGGFGNTPCAPLCFDFVCDGIYRCDQGYTQQIDENELFHILPLYR